MTEDCLQASQANSAVIPNDSDDCPAACGEMSQKPSQRCGTVDGLSGAASGSPQELPSWGVVPNLR
ncbi:MAG: hypothetical protein ACYDHX_01350 [Methanothrix sp.]